MICTGSGIAPFIAFLQELLHKKEDRDTHLYFGTKHSKYDFIYEDELKQFSSDNILKNLVTAFSRDSETKIYVQNKLSELKKDVLQLLIEKKSTIYLCGNVNMGKEVSNFFENLLTEHFSNNNEDAKKFLKELEQNNRFIKELWG